MVLTTWKYKHSFFRIQYWFYVRTKCVFVHWEVSVLGGSSFQLGISWSNNQCIHATILNVTKPQLIMPNWKRRYWFWCKLISYAELNATIFNQKWRIAQLCLSKIDLSSQLPSISIDIGAIRVIYKTKIQIEAEQKSI